MLLHLKENLKERQLEYYIKKIMYIILCMRVMWPTEE